MFKKLLALLLAVLMIVSMAACANDPAVGTKPSSNTPSNNNDDGTKRESTTWVSCILNGDGGKLLPYLKRGAQVFVEGVGSARCFSSPMLSVSW